ncbi:hypothetical protein [Pseudomonas aeruginosa]|uniref:hypothetical protein n=1 Tax=Pseudomonas aeruginosa TaxID=287 RepID=UPI00107E928E|nr:hypothetical protein [Pseudomonas aeruginosa]TGA85219.1 hypothetical protein E4V10_29335 [Pseudomonas aeruginosa]
MHLKNEAARLITIRHIVDGAKVSYQILPGENPAVEVPDEVAKTAFVKALIQNGDLRRVGADEGDDEGEDEDDIATLREQAGRAGVKVNKTWGAARLREEIAKVAAE